MRLDKILKLYLGDNQQFPDLIKAIITREILPLGNTDKAGISGLLFSSMDIRHWLRRQSSAGEVFSIVEAASQLGVKQEVAYCLVRSGYLIAESITVGRSDKTLIRMKNLDLFRNTFVDVRSIAKYWTTSSRWAVNYLKTSGVYPVTGPSVDACRQYFFRRQDLTNVRPPK